MPPLPLEPDQALIAELAKKSGISWVSYAGSTFAVWHEWVGDAVCLVAGGREQDLPGIALQQRVSLLLRSKSTRALAATVEARVEVVEHGSEHWDPITTALKSGRLNLHDSSSAIDRWARESTVVRLVPVSAPQTPGTLPTDIVHTAPRLSH